MPVGVETATDKTFLALVQDLHRECGCSGDAPTTVLNPVAGSEADRLIHWIASAWLRIQSLHDDWRFMRQTATFQTQIGVGRYTTADIGIDEGTFKRWVTTSFRVFKAVTNTASDQRGEIPVSFRQYDIWRDSWEFGANRFVQSFPIELTVLPNDGIGMGPLPNALYTVYGDYYLQPIRLVNDDDIPLLPRKHDPLLIVYKAMEYYAQYESAPEVLTRAKEGYGPALRYLLRDQLPKPQLANTVA